MKKYIAPAAVSIALVLSLAACGSSSSPAPVVTPAPVSTPAPMKVAPVVTTPAKPTETTSQKNAVSSAKSYLSFMAFSKAGLIKQLSSAAGDGYSVADATYAVNSLNEDWNNEAYLSAESYLKLMPFSHAGLVQQLDSSAGEGFTAAQAEYGVTKAGL